MKYSKQRELILKTLQENVIHPTADEIYNIARKEMPSLSLATVYRNLNQLAENNVIRKIESLDGSVHFDHNLCNHYHFICTKCHKVYDVPYDVAPDLADKVLAKTGLLVENFDISFNLLNISTSSFDSFSGTTIFICAISFPLSPFCVL